jgi:hypothetical protein
MSLKELRTPFRVVHRSGLDDLVGYHRAGECLCSPRCRSPCRPCSDIRCSRKVVHALDFYLLTCGLFKIGLSHTISTPVRPLVSFRISPRDDERKTTQRLDIVELGRNARYIAQSITVRIFERGRIDLVN